MAPNADADTNEQRNYAKCCKTIGKISFGKTTTRTIIIKKELK